MRQFTTIGRSFHTDISLPFVAARNELLQEINDIPDRFKLVLINDGKLVARINQVGFLANAPSLLFLNAADRLTVLSDDEVDHSIICFHPSLINSKFDLTNITDALDETFSETDKLDLHVLIPFIGERKTRDFPLVQLVYRRIEKLFSSIQRLLDLQVEEFWPCKSRTAMIEVLYILRALYDDKGDTETIAIDEGGDEIDKILLFIHTKYDSKITIDDLARSFHSNRTTLSSTFKRKTGMSIIDYTNRLRVEIACQILRDTNVKMVDIADRTGFSDISALSRAFKRYVGQSPTTYRKHFAGPMS